MRLFSSPSLQKRDSRLPLLLCFFIPFAACGLGLTVLSALFGSNALYPFGDGMILAHDGWHQYYPFFQELRDKLTSGGSLQYTWTIGMGTGWASLFAYYLASPLNLLCVLVPEGYMPELFALLTILKLGLAGLFMGVFFRRVYGKNDLSLPFFALAYALCSWACGYYWNNMWLDAFALLPLLVTGTVTLLREGRFRLYIGALALTLWCNYYVAYFCCIFVLLSFIGYNLVCWNGLGNFLRRFVRIGVCTLIGVGLTAALLLPTLSAMQHTYAATAKELRPLALNIATGANGYTSQGQSMAELFRAQTLPGLLEGSQKILANLMSVPRITKMEGLPNVFCGFSTLLLAVYYFCCKKITLREKLFHLFLLLFFGASFLFRVLDYVWHGFHFPNMLPYRFSFLYSFVLISMAFRAYTLMDGFKKWYLLIILPLGTLLIYNLYRLPDIGVRRLIINVMILAAMVLFFLIFPSKKEDILHRFLQKRLSQAQLLKATGIRRVLACILLFSVLSLEMGLCLFLGASKIGFTTRSAYPKENGGVQALLEYTRETTDELFWRTEVTATQTLNDGSLNGYNGVSVFTSSANVNFNRFSRSLGFSAWPGSNRFSYYEASPLANTMAGIRYLLDRDGKLLSPRYNKHLATSDNVNLLECDSYVGLGFMTRGELANFVTEKGQTDPFAEQAQIFSLATGLDGADLYRKLRFHHSLYPTDQGCTLIGGGPQFTYNAEKATGDCEYSLYFTVDNAGMYCASAQSNTIKEVKFYRNGTYLGTRNLRAQSLFSIGEYQADDEIKLVFTAEGGKKGSFSASVGRFNHQLYEDGLALLKDEPWMLTQFSDTHIEGVVDAKEDGLFYTSVPYEPGWTAEVDGTPVPLAATYDSSSASVKLTDAVIAFPLSAGKHQIVLTYRTPGLTGGLLISLGSFVILVGLLWLCRKTKTLLPDIAPEVPAPVEEEDDAWLYDETVFAPPVPPEEESESEQAENTDIL